MPAERGTRVDGIRAWIVNTLQQKPGVLPSTLSSVAAVIFLLLLRLAVVGVVNRSIRRPCEH